jgi:hypothetical protein
MAEKIKDVWQVLEDIPCGFEPQRLWHIVTLVSSPAVADPEIARNMMGFSVIYEGTLIAEPRF